MKNPKLAIILGAFILLVSFQNCQKNSQALNSSENPSTVNSVSQKVSLSQEPAQHIVLSYEEQKTEKAGDFSIQKIVTTQFSIDLLSKKIRMTSSDGNIQLYCLQDDLLQELNSLLSQSEICKNEKPASDNLCSMQFKPAYAEIDTQRDHFKIGEDPGGCAAVVDFCQDYMKSMLQGWLVSLKNQLPKQSCQ